MFYFKVMHKYKLIDHYEKKEIGIYTSLEKAKDAIEGLSDKPGFKNTVYGFKIKKVFRLFKPKWVDRTFWEEGFDTYTYRK